MHPRHGHSERRHHGPHHSHCHPEHNRRFARGERGFDGPFGHRRHGGGRGGLGRLFAHGDLRLVLLQLIAEKPRHGYELIKAIEEKVGGAYSPSPGVIYPTLTLLEEQGYVTASTEPGGTRKLHDATPEGRAFLAANQAAVEALLARMAEAAERHGGEPAPQIIRAMENLKLALRLRLHRGRLSEDAANAIAAALDEAARAVERS
ncbi:PadR family transcriptional regulator [Siccirubricoccus sp. KC 17139]|uniref:PadR family transcriptional regulator n=1 Tax=Siccirubricoccus soli TaxID=2899147 RepID=A0ABT1D283_9PROT|nr:PadR family transcriptional regulator [Siccirubricoccus soli]MCO6415349.1 PadR family transcriptional regulator [Siccirubricoccus soli]MCP2681481.1 PadR family transcriptional regulator [Siccirubricoccus soli]